MLRKFDDLGAQEFDLLIIGGGIFGVCAAWDAVLRGLSVALVEKVDFAAGVSANSYKIVHGGIRYLQHADIPRLRASCAARSALLRIAPHLVKPLPIAIPTYGHGREGKAFLGAGMLVYDLLTLDRNRGISSVRQQIPGTRFLSAGETLERFPGLPDRGLTGAAVFCDGQLYNPTRLVWAFARSAADHGAVVVNHAECTELLCRGNRVIGAQVRDGNEGPAIDVRAKIVLNAAGPWVPWMKTGSMELARSVGGAFSRDACFVVPRRYSHDLALAIQGATRDPDAILSRSARHLFVVPWRDYTLCGVWHRVWAEHPDTVSVNEDELQSFIDELNGAMPALELDLSEVRMWNAGLVPFGENAPGARNLSYGKRSHIVDHTDCDGIDGLVSLVGVRYTMARPDAAAAVDLVCGKLGRVRPRPHTESQPIHGGDFDELGGLIEGIRTGLPNVSDESVMEALARNYGTAYTDVLKHAQSQPDLALPLPGATTLGAEIVHAIREEMAVTLADVVFRRTDLATGGHPGTDALEVAARLAGSVLEWSDSARNAEIAAVERRFFSRKATVGAHH